MTKEELLECSKEMVEALEEAQNQDCEITIDGNGCNSSEAGKAIIWYHELILDYINGAS